MILAIVENPQIIGPQVRIVVDKDLLYPAIYYYKSKQWQQLHFSPKQVRVGFINSHFFSRNTRMRKCGIVYLFGN